MQFQSLTDAMLKFHVSLIIRARLRREHLINRAAMLPGAIARLQLPIQFNGHDLIGWHCVFAIMAARHIGGQRHAQRLIRRKVGESASCRMNIRMRLAIAYVTQNQVG